MRTRSTLSKFFRLPARAKLTLGEILCVTVLIKLGLRLMPFSWVLAVVRRLPTARPRSIEPPVEEVLRLARAVWRRAPMPITCLPQSLILLVLLTHRGVPAELKIGVKTSGSRLRAHAWLEQDECAFLESRDVHRQFPAVLSVATHAPSS